MEYEDRLTVATPEGVELDLALAGLGSRFIAVLGDLLLKAVIVGLGAIVLVATGSGGVATGVFIAYTFLVFWLYDVFFEVLASGRTPGKRWAGLRVVSEGGAPVGLRASLVRNLVRMVDGPASFYVAGPLAILITARNQRLGDLAAGTLVLRERRAADRAAAAADRPASPATQDPGRADVSAVSTSDLATVRAFLERRHALEAGARESLAEDLASRLRPKVAGVSEEDGAERFLEVVASARGGEGAAPS